MPSVTIYDVASIYYPVLAAVGIPGKEHYLVTIRDFLLPES